MTPKEVVESWFWLKQNVDMLIRYGIKHHEIGEGDRQVILQFVEEVDNYINRYEQPMEEIEEGYTDYGYVGADGIERVNDYESEEK